MAAPTRVQVFREDTGAWVVAPMHSVVHNLSAAAQAADQELRQAGQRPDKLGDCGDQLRKCFSVSLQAPGAAPLLCAPNAALRSGESGGRQAAAGRRCMQVHWQERVATVLAHARPEPGLS